MATTKFFAIRGIKSIFVLPMVMIKRMQSKIGIIESNQRKKCRMGGEDMKIIKICRSAWEGEGKKRPALWVAVGNLGFGLVVISAFTIWNFFFTMSPIQKLIFAEWQLRSDEYWILKKDIREIKEKGLELDNKIAELNRLGGIKSNSFVFLSNEINDMKNKFYKHQHRYYDGKIIK